MALPPDLQQRIGAARADRGRRQTQINSYLRFADPTKPRIGDSQVVQADRAYEADELFDSTLQEVSEDFGSDLLGRVMPRQANWLAYAPQDTIDDAVKQAIGSLLKSRTDAIFAAIRASDFYDEAASEWALDQGHGTSAIICTDPGRGQPLHFQAIPPSQLLIERGGQGGTSFRGREYMMAAEEALALWPDGKWPARLRQQAKRPNGRRTMWRVLECAERIYDPGDEVWVWRTCVQDEVIAEERLTGRGCCPILVSRWRTHPSSAWGVGPLLKALPDARTLDQERYLILKNMGKTVDPPVTYDDDGVINVEGGVGAGSWIPRVPGSKIDVLPVEGSLSAAYYEAGNLQDNIRRAGFQDGWDQKGKTPPTLGQWAGEEAKSGRRLEMPTGKLYAESVIAICDRVEFLLVARGAIQPMVKAKDQLIKVRPLNPLSKQQDMEEVSTAMNLLQQGNAVFGPQVMAALIDGAATFLAIKDRVNDNLVQLRATSAAAPLLAGALHADPGGGGAPPAAPDGDPTQ